MIQAQISSEQPFPSAFVLTTFCPSLQLYDHLHQQIPSNYVTDLLITEITKDIVDSSVKVLELRDNIYVCIYRDHKKSPICKISNTPLCEQQYEQIQVDIENNPELKLYAQRTSTYSTSDKIVDICVVQMEESLDNKQSEIENGNPCYFHSIKILGKQLVIKYQAQTKESRLPISLKPYTTPLFQKNQNEIQIPSISNFCFPKGIQLYRKQSGCKTFNFTILNNSTERIYCTTLCFRQKVKAEQKEKLKTLYNIDQSERLYSQKAFILISKYSCTDQTTQYLQQLFFLYLQKGQQALSRTIEQIGQTFQMNEKKKKVNWKLNGSESKFKINSSYPKTSENAIYAVFKFLQIQSIIQVIEAMLLEHKIFFVSDCNKILGFAIEAFQSFIYPFTWIHNIVPQLNHKMIDYTHAPMPLLFGMSNQLASQIQQVQGIFVYLDNNKVIYKITGDRIELKPKLRKLVIEKLNRFMIYDRVDVREYLKNTENIGMFKTKQEEDPHFDAIKIRNVLFELMVFLLKNYKLYFKQSLQGQLPKAPLPLKKIYDFERIKKNSIKDPFSYALFDTSLFQHLIEIKTYEPKHKWIKTLDKSIKKISKTLHKEIIQEQSDTQSDYTEYDTDNQQIISKGCFDILHIFNKQSEEDKMSSPSPRKSCSPKFREKSIESVTKPSCNENIEDQNIDRKNSISTNGKNSLSDAGDNQFPELQEIKNQEKIKYEDADGEIIQNKGLCVCFSYPYTKLKKSISAKWISYQKGKLDKWRKKHEVDSQKCPNTIQVDMMTDNKRQEEHKQEKQMKKIESIESNQDFL